MLSANRIDWEDRKEIWYLLTRLQAWQRLDFLAWCCLQVDGPLKPSVPAKHSATANEVYLDLMQLEFSYQLVLERVALELVQWVRKRRRYPRAYWWRRLQRSKQSQSKPKPARSVIPA